MYRNKDCDYSAAFNYHILQLELILCSNLNYGIILIELEKCQMKNNR